MERHVAESAEALNELWSLLEFWIDLDGLEERADSSLVIPLLHIHRKKLLGLFGAEQASSDRAGQLVIDEVVSVEVKDKARVGSYDINDLSFDHSRQALVIRSSMPLTLTIVVRRLHVVLELE